MHQTPQGLLRMTDENRPWAKDLLNLFSTLMLSLLPLSTQHSWSTKVEHTFSSADAIDNLASISFSQSNQTPENGNASKIVTTTVTVTYSMSEETALRVCQMFLDAGLMESSGRKQEHMAKNLLWRLTSKGVCILDRFCTRNGVGFKSQAEVVAVSLPEVVVLERCRRTDRLATDHGTINVIFIRFFRTNRAMLTEPDSPKVLRARASQPGLKGATSPQRKAASCNPKFTGEAITDWLIEYTTVVDRGEAIAITRLFVEYGLIEEVQGMVHETDRAWTVPRQAAKPMYQVTEHGEFIATSDSLGDHIMKSAGSETFWSELARCSHAQQLEKALGSSAMRLLFREHLRRTHCEENLSFYSDGDELISKCRQAIATHEDPGNMATALQEIAARACGLYNTFLAPGSPRELNINNRLRNNIATHIMTITAPDGTLNTLGGLITALEEARTSVFNLMTNDSLPKFFESIRDTQTAEDPRILYL